MLEANTSRAKDEHLARVNWKLRVRGPTSMATNWSTLGSLRQHSLLAMDRLTLNRHQCGRILTQGARTPHNPWSWAIVRFAYTICHYGLQPSAIMKWVLAESSVQLRKSTPP